MVVLGREPEAQDCDHGCCAKLGHEVRFVVVVTRDGTHDAEAAALVLKLMCWPMSGGSKPAMLMPYVSICSVELALLCCSPLEVRRLALPTH